MQKPCREVVHSNISASNVDSWDIVFVAENVHFNINLLLELGIHTSNTYQSKLDRSVFMILQVISLNSPDKLEYFTNLEKGYLGYPLVNSHITMENHHC